MMGTTASLQDRLCCVLFSKAGVHLAALELAPRHWTFLLIDTVQLRHVLGPTDRGALNFIWVVLGWRMTIQLGTRCRRAVHPDNRPYHCPVLAVAV